MPTLRTMLDNEEKAKLELAAMAPQPKEWEVVTNVEKPDEKVLMPSEQRYEKGEWIKHQLKKER